jgi:hypothetical protein
MSTHRNRFAVLVTTGFLALGTTALLAGSDGGRDRDRNDLATTPQLYSGSATTPVLIKASPVQTPVLHRDRDNNK